MKIKLIDWTFEIDVDDEKIINFFSEYLSDEKTDYKISVNQSDVDFEVKNSDFSLYNCYLLAIYRKIIDILNEKDVFLFHSSALICDDLGILISGHSGSGKSTHASLYRQYGNVTMINDDKPLIRYTDGKFIVYGTPYMGKHGLGNNINHEVNRICFVKQSKTNSIRKVEGKEKLELLINQTDLSDNVEKRIRTINLINKMALCIEVYLLECDISKDAYELSFRTLCQK